MELIHTGDCQCSRCLGTAEPELELEGYGFVTRAGLMHKLERVEYCKHTRQWRVFTSVTNIFTGETDNTPAVWGTKMFNTNVRLFKQRWEKATKDE